MDKSDQELIAATGRGDHCAFEQLVHRYKDRIFNFSCRYLGDRGAAEDVAQETFLRVFRSADRFEPRGRVSTWMYAIAYHLCINELKRCALRRRLQEDLERAWPSGHHEPARRWEIERDVAAALLQLPENQRAALVLKVNEELSYVEIGEVLGISTSGVEALLFRARKRLRQLLKEH